MHLPKVVEKVNDSILKQAFKDHLKETKEQKSRLEQICEELNISPTGETCKAMKGLIKETESFMDEAESEEVMDAGLIAEAQRVEHYEIAGYGTAVRYAKELGHKDIANMLQKSLDEQYNADNKLDKLAESRLNERTIS